MLCTFDFLLFYNFGEKSRRTTGTLVQSGWTNNELQFSFGRTERMSDAFLCTTDNLTNGSADNVRGRPIF